MWQTELLIRETSVALAFIEIHLLTLELELEEKGIINGNRLDVMREQMVDITAELISMYQDVLSGRSSRETAMERRTELIERKTEIIRRGLMHREGNA
jgi:hypothetical protein